MTTQRRAHDSLPAVLEAAAARIEMSLRESREPIEEFTGAIGRLATSAAQLRTAHGGVPGVARYCDAIESEVRASIERLQFYDRMTQELTLVRDCLAEAAVDGGAQRPAGAWESLRTRICDRLTSESQRALLWTVVSEPVQSDGTVELF